MKTKHPFMRMLAGLPLGVLYLISDTIYPIIYYMIRYRRRLVRENRIKYFAEADYSEGTLLDKLVKQIIDRTVENEKLEELHYQALADV